MWNSQVHNEEEEVRARNNAKHHHICGVGGVRDPNTAPSLLSSHHHHDDGDNDDGDDGDDGDDSNTGPESGEKSPLLAATMLLPPLKPQQHQHQQLPLHATDEDHEECGGEHRHRLRIRPPGHGYHRRGKINKTTSGTRGHLTEQCQTLCYSMVYAAVNAIVAVPCLYGYTAVIFNHAIFQPHRDALAKLVMFSSLIHQMGFVLFSSLSGFAIGTVQDAGLIFLSGMSNAIANRMTLQAHDESAVVSTTLVLLSAGTALLGFCLFCIGKMKLANVVSYLPMPVVGGYLAFIGYFCLQAGIGLAISKPMVTFADWIYLFEDQNWIMALPALLAGCVLTMASRWSSNAGSRGSSGVAASCLPLCMILIPALFYVIVYFFFANDDIEQGDFLQHVRNQGWVGPVAPPTPVSDVLALVKFDLVEWKMVGIILWMWVGMVFVVSLASCLDVAAISLDMGEALDTNRELSTVGICNFMSGLTLGYTGSYIFSQTIFTYRTGVHSRWIGIFIMAIYSYVVISPMNLLQVSPLFLLGSTLIFIGYDLMYEWLYEIRPRILWSEYATIWGTFIFIQIVGVDAGIALGVLWAMVEHAISNAQTTTVHAVPKRSRAIWNKDEYQFLHEHVYHVKAPKIVTLEVAGPVFFGSSVSLVDRLREEVSLPSSLHADDPSSTTCTPNKKHCNHRFESTIESSPLTSSYFLAKDKRPSFFRHEEQNAKNFLSKSLHRTPPQFCILDLTQISNVDASSARTCFLQFCKICSKHGITVCATGATPRIAWLLRKHDAAYPREQEEERVKAQLHAMESTMTTSNDDGTTTTQQQDNNKILLFRTTLEALEFAEACLIHQFHGNVNTRSSGQLTASTTALSTTAAAGTDEETSKLSTILARFLVGSTTTGLSQEEMETVLKRLDGQRYHSELDFQAGEKIMVQETRPQSFYVVLEGAVARGVVNSETVVRHQKPIVSGAGPIRISEHLSYTNLFDALSRTTLSGGSVVGEERQGTAASATATTDPTTSSTPIVVHSVWPVGGVFGFTDLLLDRPRAFGAFAAQNKTRVARITRSNMNLLQQEDDQLKDLLHQVLLLASVLDLVNL